MNNTNFIPPQIIFSNGQITGNSWGTPNNILLVDGQYATSDVVTGSASDFILGNFNLNLPQDAVPTGIEIEIIGHRGAQTIPPISLNVSLYDDTNGANTFYPYTAPITSLLPTDSTIVIGGSTYLFASSFTVDQINNLKLAFTANGDISLDSVLVRVYYFIQTPVTPPVIVPGVCVDCSSPIQVQAMYLELPFLIGQTKFYLKKGSFSYPNGIPVQPGDVGSCGGTIPFVFDESKRKMDGQNFEENAMLDTNNGGTWTVLTSGVIEVDLGFITQRGLDYKTPAAHIASNMSDHDANSKVIISNNEPYNLQLLRTCQVDTVFSAPIIIENQGVPLPSPAHDISFEGAGVSTANDGLNPFRKKVTIPGFSPIPPSIVTTINFYNNTPVTNYSTPGITITGTDRFLAVALTLDTGVAVASALFNGVAVPVVTSSSIGSFVVIVLDLIAPSLGTHTLDLIFTGLTRLAGNIVLYNQVDQVTPMAANVALGGNSALVSISPTTTTVNSVVFHAFGTAQFPILYTAGVGESIVSQTVGGLLQNGIENQTVGTPALVTSQVNLSVITDWADIAFGINGIAPVLPPGSPLEVDDEGVPVELNTTKMNFVGPGVVVTPGAPGEVIVTITGGGGSGGNILVDQTPDNGTYGTLAGLVDGINTTFTVSAGVYITGKLQVYLNGLIQLQGATDDWEELLPGSGTFDFIVPPLVGDIITVVYQTTAGGSGGTSVQMTVNQVAHGFSAGQIVRNDGTPNSYTLAQADTTAHAEVTGYVDSVIDANNFVLVTEGFVTGGVPAQVEGTIMFLDAAIAGALTATEPTASPTVSKPLLEIIENAVTGYFHNYRGQENQTVSLSSSVQNYWQFNAAQPTFQGLTPYMVAGSVEEMYGVRAAGWSANNVTVTKIVRVGGSFAAGTGGSNAVTKFNGAAGTSPANGQPTFALPVGNYVYVLCGDGNQAVGGFMHDVYFEVFDRATMVYQGATNTITLALPANGDVWQPLVATVSGSNIYVCYGKIGGFNTSINQVAIIGVSGTLVVALTSTSALPAPYNTASILNFDNYGAGKATGGSNIFLNIGKLDHGAVYDISVGVAVFVASYPFTTLPTPTATVGHIFTGFGQKLIIYDEATTGHFNQFDFTGLSI